MTGEEQLYIGIMSGTSLDGIDAVLCRFGPSSVQVLGSASERWPNELRSLVLEFASAETVAMDSLARANFALSACYASLVHQLLTHSGYEADAISAIGLHGQTVRHLPKKASIMVALPPMGATLQLGSGPVLAALTGIDVVHDFRSADIALGGEGAPLVPMFDRAFLQSNEHSRMIVNIGGIANVTFLSPDDDRVVAFDTGPGNMIIDSLMQRFAGLAFDRDGEVARSGKVDETLLEEFLSHEYFIASPPKSTGRELVQAVFIPRCIALIAEGHSLENVVATATEVTARAIAAAPLLTGFSPREVIVSGGGAQNTYLMHRLQELLKPASVQASDAFGIPVQLKEAIAFAYFAMAHMQGESIHLPATTGASRPITLGSLARGR